MASDARSTLGDRLRQLRKQNRWTLSQVSAMTALATSTLSKVENNQTSLTYDNLLKLAEGLGIDFADLFASADIQQTSGRRAITRHGEPRLQTTPNYDYHYHSTDLSRRRMVPIYVEIKARSIEEFDNLLRHSGEEFIYVLEGTIEVHTEFYEPVALEVGESIYLDSGMGHAYISIGDGDAKILGVCSSPGSNPSEAIAITPVGNRRSRKRPGNSG